MVSGWPAAPKVVASICGHWRTHHMTTYIIDVSPLDMTYDLPWELGSWGRSPVVSGLPTAPKVVVSIHGHWRIHHMNMYILGDSPLGMNMYLLGVLPLGMASDLPWELGSWGGSPVVSGLPTAPKVVVSIHGHWRI